MDEAVQELPARMEAAPTALVSSHDRFGPRSAASESVQRAAKRCCDLAIVALVLVPAVLLILAAALLIAVVDRQRPFFVDRRVGRGGRLFGCVKLRTMRCAQDDFSLFLLENPVEADLYLASRKVVADPRKTRLGSFLRRSSLDELPQLYNVLVGDMSVVGPRPLSIEEFDARDAEYGESLLRVRPGLTGLWQVKGRSDLSVEDRLRYDEYYARNWSLRLDLRILRATPGAVLSGRGAR
jgi:exopolysaccharide production protein ExoY